MALEIEKKYRIDKRKLVELTARLAEVGAVFAYERFEENYLHRGGHLVEQNAYLRVRKTDSENTLTYKEKVVNDTDFKHQIEFETLVSDVEATEHIIEKLVTIWLSFMRNTAKRGISAGSRSCSTSFLLAFTWRSRVR